jgi:predicted transcriptional regulator
VSPACGKVIDALLAHSELNTAQLKVAAGIGSRTVSDSIFKLNKLGLITKNGGRFSLKQF